MHGVTMSTIQWRIGQRIQLLRDAAGLTQAQLADRAGVNPEHISRIERAEKGPSIELLDRIAGALGLPIRDLFNFDEVPTLDPKKAALLTLLDEADKELVDLLATVAETLVRRMRSDKP